MRLLPQLLTRTGVPNIAAAPARLPPEWWPASGRNGGPLHVGAVAHFNIGMLARFASEYPARFRRNSHLRIPLKWAGYSGLKWATAPT